MRIALASLLALAAACGHTYERVEVVQGPPVRHVSTQTLPGYHAPAVVVQAPPVPAAPVASAPAPAGNAPIRCEGDQRIRVHNRRVDGAGGPALVASGNCVVEVTEAILVGRPALVLAGNAHVSVVESRVLGEIVTDGHAQLDMRGSTNEL